MSSSPGSSPRCPHSSQRLCAGDRGVREEDRLKRFRVRKTTTKKNSVTPQNVCVIIFFSLYVISVMFSGTSPTVQFTLTPRGSTPVRSTRMENWCRRPLGIRKLYRREKVIIEDFCINLCRMFLFFTSFISPGCLRISLIYMREKKEEV